MGGDPQGAAIKSPTVILYGWGTVAATATALSATAEPIKSVTIENVSTNDVVYIGDADVTILNGYALRAGATVSLDIDDLNKVYHIGTAGNVITYIAVN